MWWIIAALILLGIILMFVETLLMTGLGVVGILSLCSMGAACWYAFTFVGNVAGVWTVVSVCVLLLAVTAVLLRKRTWKRFELNEKIESKVNVEAENVKAGEKGLALTRLAPMGTAEFGSVTCEVKSHDNSMIDAGSMVEIMRIEDNKVIVKQIKRIV